MGNFFVGLPDVTLLLKALIIFGTVGWILGMWKLVEIIFWLLKNVSITVGS